MPQVICGVQKGLDGQVKIDGDGFKNEVLIGSGKVGFSRVIPKFLLVFKGIHYSFLFLIIRPFHCFYCVFTSLYFEVCIIASWLISAVKIMFILLTCFIGHVFIVHF